MKEWFCMSLFMIFLVSTCAQGQEQSVLNKDISAVPPLQQKVTLPDITEKSLTDVLAAVINSTSVPIHIVKLCHSDKDTYNGPAISITAGEYTLGDILQRVQHSVSIMTWTVFQNNIDICLKLVNDVPNPFLTIISESQELSLSRLNFAGWLHKLRPEYAVIPVFMNSMTNSAYNTQITTGYMIQDVIDLFADKASCTWAATVFDSPNEPSQRTHTEANGVVVLQLNKVMIVSFITKNLNGCRS